MASWLPYGTTHLAGRSSSRPASSGLAGCLVQSPEKATLALSWALGRQQGDLGMRTSLEMGGEDSQDRDLWVTWGWECPCLDHSLFLGESERGGMGSSQTLPLEWVGGQKNYRKTIASLGYDRWDVHGRQKDSWGMHSTAPERSSVGQALLTPKRSPIQAPHKEPHSRC